MSRSESIYRGLSRAYKNLLSDDKIRCNIESSRIVIFSDQHRGVRDGADDFKLCEGAYCAALEYYFKRGYTLIILGDAEDLWECRPSRVIRAYESTLKLEAKFYTDREDSYYRINGNHDDYWLEKGSIDIYGIRIPVREKFLIRLYGNNNKSVGDIFLVHGHQGGHLMKISKFLIRYLWRPFQRITQIKSTTPATNAKLRGVLNIAMYNWALGKNEEKKKLLLIAGHTHLPVFASKDHIGKIVDEVKHLEEKLYRARISGDHDADDLALQVEEKRVELERRKAKSGMKEDQNGIFMDKPCYFNSGCCSYSDGDITGLEVSDGEIKLVRWPRDNPAAEVLETADLRKEIFGRL